MIVGYACGVFDLIHIGHINLLKNACELCDKLIIGLSTDECIKYKNKNTVIPYEDRKKILESISYVSFVVPQTNTDKYEAWERLKFNVLFVGDDWYNTKKWNNFEEKFKKVNVKIIYFPYTQKCSTTLIKKKIINKTNILLLFDLDKTLWDFYTNLLSEEEFDNKLKTYEFTDDIIRIFRYLKINSIQYAFVSRSKYPERCRSLLKKISIDLDDNYYSIKYTPEKTKLPHVQEIIGKSDISPEFMILFDDDQENIDSVNHIINKSKLVCKDKNLTFEDFIDTLKF